MKLKYLTLFLVILIFLISACVTQSAQTVCSKPYILVGNDCCLDKDSNSICDKDEIIETIEEEEIAIDENITEEIVEEVSTKEKTEVSESEDDDKFKTDGLHWTHMPITYNIFNPSHYGVDCGPYESNKIRKGFSRIQNDTNGVVHFKEIENLEAADIAVSCAYIKDCYEYNAKKVGDYMYITESICDYDAGMAKITENENNKILKAEIIMVGLFGFSETRNKEASGFYIGSCGHPSTEIHEILHTFGYEHVNDDNSIMYFQDDEIGATKLNAGECIGSKKEIDDWIVKDLIKTYSRR